jgi:hypothetical protein
MWEGFVITQELYEAEGRNTKFIPVLFSPDDLLHIPLELRGATRYDLSYQQDYDNLFRHLTNQPRWQRSDVGPLRPMPPEPSPLPPVPALERKQAFRGAFWNVPIPQNPFFTGREKVLQDIGSALKSGGSAALTGLPGIGKTETAAQYSYLHRDEYHAVLWASAASRDTLVSDFAAIAQILGLPQKDAPHQNLAVLAAKRWLETSPGWLLILDNANDLGRALPSASQQIGRAEGATARRY